MPQTSDPSEPSNTSRFRIKRLVSAASWYEAEISACVRAALPFGDPRWAQVQEGIKKSLTQVASLCQQEGVSPESLPLPSRRAYQWLRFLSEADHLRLHASTLSRLIAVDGRAQVHLYHIGGWWKAWHQGNNIRLTVSEAFVGAPEHVLTSLVKLGLPYTKKRLHRKVIEDYAETAGFKAMLARLEGPEAAIALVTKGRCRDLDEVFLRVNRDYFEGRLERPRMGWSRSVSRGEFGHYQPSTDTITINRALDAPEVPLCAIDYVMFHELLHKKLGTMRVNGRRRLHTPEFRTAERRFVDFSEASAYLVGLSKAIRTMRRRGRRRRPR